MSAISSRRLQKEYVDLQTGKGCPEGTSIIKMENMKHWQFTLSCLGESVYKDETFGVNFVFPTRYPMAPPIVTFLVNDTYKAPAHPHIYSNGHICLSILADDWSPVLNTSSVLLSLQSMLASCKKKEIPPDNSQYVARAYSDPSKASFYFHDDTV